MWPAIARTAIERNSRPGNVVLDPMAGVGLRNPETCRSVQRRRLRLSNATYFLSTIQLLAGTARTMATWRDHIEV